MDCQLMGDMEKIEYELRGKTLKVYLYMLKQGKPVGVREVQRDLGFSSPSVAFHHLEKLGRLKVVQQDQAGDYLIATKVNPGILQAFVNVGRFSLPRVGFYGMFFTTVGIAYVLSDASSLNLYALVGTLGGAAVFWYELLRLRRRKLF